MEKAVTVERQNDKYQYEGKVWVKEVGWKLHKELQVMQGKNLLKWDQTKLPSSSPFFWYSAGMLWVFLLIIQMQNGKSRC